MDLPTELARVVVPVGGGWLVAATILAAGACRVVGVEPCGAATLDAALKAGAPETLAKIESVAADALGAGRVGVWPFALCRERLDRVEMVDDGAILDAQRWFWTHLRLAVEPWAAAGLAALAHGAFDRDTGAIGLVVSGGNMDLRTLV